MVRSGAGHSARTSADDSLHRGRTDALGIERGLYWMGVGVIAVFVLSMFNVWVLLVEILR